MSKRKFDLSLTADGRRQYTQGGSVVAAQSVPKKAKVELTAQLIESPQLKERSIETYLKLTQDMTPAEIMKLCRSSPKLNRHICENEAFWRLWSHKKVKSQLEGQPLHVYVEMTKNMSFTRIAQLCRTSKALQRDICANENFWRLWYNENSKYTTYILLHAISVFVAEKPLDSKCINVSKINIQLAKVIKYNSVWFEEFYKHVEKIQNNRVSRMYAAATCMLDLGLKKYDIWKYMVALQKKKQFFTKLEIKPLLAGTDKYAAFNYVQVMVNIDLKIVFHYVNCSADDNDLYKTRSWYKLMYAIFNHTTLIPTKKCLNVFLKRYERLKNEFPEEFGLSHVKNTYEKLLSMKKTAK